MLCFEDFTRGLTSNMIPEFLRHVEQILRTRTMLFDQKRNALAAAAMRTLPYPEVSLDARALIQREVIELIGEGSRPYHPRYVAPDYGRLLREGSAFMDLAPAKTMHEAVASLLVAYHYFPSDGLPVFIGRLDELLEPYFDSVDPQTTRAILRSFWLMVDRMHPNGFVHANLGPHASRTGSLLLDLDMDLQTITNISLRYDPDITPEPLALQAVRNQLAMAKPYFVNHQLMLKDFGADYVIASCYNSMLLRGGIYTLVRCNFLEMVRLSDGTLHDVLENVIPRTAALAVEVIRSRIISLVEDFKWFEDNFWVSEGLIDPTRFSAYLGMFALAEAVHWLLERQGHNSSRYGTDPEANALGRQLTARMNRELHKHRVPYCEGWGERVMFHAQVGISSDQNLTPGARVPGGTEPPLYEHLQCEAPHHASLTGGASTILEFDQTARTNHKAVLDIERGALQSGIRTLSVGCRDSEFIRVSGYLVRRSDLEDFQQERAGRYATTDLAGDFLALQPNHLHRRQRKV